MTKTESLCPICNKKLEAELTETDGKILITKTCPEHGTFYSSHWQSPSVFRFTENYDFFKYFEEENLPQRLKVVHTFANRVLVIFQIPSSELLM